MRANTYTSLKGEREIEFDIDRIKAAAEANGGDPNVSTSNLGILHANRARSLDNLVAAVRQKNADVLKTVSVPTGIQDSIGLYTNQIPTGSSGGTAGESVFRHSYFLHSVS